MERKYGPNEIEWNEDSKCKVKAKEKGNHNITPLLRLKSQTSRSMIIFQVEVDCAIGGIFGRPSMFNSFKVKNVFEFF